MADEYGPSLMTMKSGGANLPAVRRWYSSFLAGRILTGDGEEESGPFSGEEGGLIADSQDFAEKARDKALTKVEQLNTSLGGLDVSLGASVPDELSISKPDFSDITIPEKPDVEYTDSTLSFPNLEGFTPPAVTSLPSGATVPTEIINRLKEEFGEGLDPEGYSPDVERAIYDRARTRREADLQQKKNQATAQMAKRGFLAPPGALHDLLLQYDVEGHREETDLNRDIVRTQADLIRQRYEQILALGQQLAQVDINVEELENRTAMERARQQYQFALERFNAELRTAEAQGNLAQAEIQHISAKMQIEQIKVDAFRAEIQGRQARVDLESAKGQVYASMAQAEATLGSAQADLAKAESDMKVAKFEAQNRATQEAANVCAQLAASAMSAVNASVQLSGQQSDHNQHSYSLDVGRRDSYNIHEQKTSSDSE